MIILRPSNARVDSGSPFSLLARNDHDSGPSGKRPQRPKVKGQDDLPCAIPDRVAPSPSVAPSSPSPSSSDSSTTVTPSIPPVTPSLPPTTSSFPPSVSSSFPTVVTSSTGLDPTSPSPSIPLTATVLSSSSTSPSPLWSDPPPGLVVSVPGVSTSTTQSYLLSFTPSSTLAFESPFLPPAMTPTNSGLWRATDGLDAEPGLSPMSTNTDEIAPDPSLDSVSQAGLVARNRMIGAIAGSALVASLVLFGVIFYLRRRVSRRSFGRVVDTARAMPNAPSRSTSSRVKEQREGGIVMQDRNPFLDPTNSAIRNSTLTVTTGQKQWSHLDRYSQISTTSTSSKSIRFVAPGSYHSPTNSRSSRITISVAPTDVAHTFTPEPLTPPHSPASAKTPVDHSAPWRGTNLSNIINAARGVKT